MAREPRASGEWRHKQICASLYWPGIFQWFQDEKRGVGKGAESDRAVRCSLGTNIVHEGHEETRRKVKKQAHWQSLRFIPDFMHVKSRRATGRKDWFNGNKIRNLMHGKRIDL